jgi:hypothetical protein
MVKGFAAALSAALTIGTAACASAPKAGAIGETPAVPARITAVDSGRPPRNVSVQLDQQSYAAVLLVAPGHSATLLYPADSTTNNRLDAGTHVLPVTVPERLVQTDSVAIAGLIRARDSARVRVRGPTMRTPPIPTATPTYLLVITSPQQLDYQRIVARTVGVSIPLQDLEALNAVGKAIKGTLTIEPREWHGFYQMVELRRPAS